VWSSRPVKEERGVAQNGSSVEQRAERAKRKISSRIERLARFGCLAYAVVYVRVGVLALQAAFGAGLYQFYKAYKADFHDELECHEKSLDRRIEPA
jgi:putative component of toxin-antitoxin plasmid stabilization module